MTSSRMLKKSASFVLAALRGSSYVKKYDSPLRWLRPRWTVILNTLRGSVSSCATFKQAISSRRKIVFQQPARR